MPAGLCVIGKLQDKVLKNRKDNRIRMRWTDNGKSFLKDTKMWSVKGK